LNGISDDELINRTLTGDERAFGLLVDKYKKRIYYLALRMTHNHDVADELAQESFVRAYQALNRFKRGLSFYTWIYKICLNLTINFIKREKFTVSTDDFEETTLPDSLITYDSQLEQIISSEQAAVVRMELEKIPSEQKAAFLLKTYEDLSYEQIAEIMECSIGTVMSRLYRARAKLRKALKEYELRKGSNNE